MVAVGVEADGGLDGLEEGVFGYAGEYEVAFVEGFGAFGRGSDADGGEGVADGEEEGGFFGEGSGVGDDGVGVHLQGVVVVESEGLVLDYAGVQLEAGCFEAFAGAGVAGVEDRHVVLAGQGVDGREEGEEVAVRVDIFFAVGAEENVFSFFEAEATVDVAGFYLGEVFVEHFGHR